MLLHDSRRGARTDADGELVLLDRPGPVAVGPRADRRGPRAGRAGRAARRAAAVRASRRRSPPSTRAPSDAEDTDWERIVRLYAWLAELDPSPVVELNRAVAVAMADGPEARARAGRRDPGPRRLRALPRRARRPAAAARAPARRRAPTSARRSSRRTRSSAPSSSGAGRRCPPTNLGACEPRARPARRSSPSSAGRSTGSRSPQRASARPTSCSTRRRATAWRGRCSVPSSAPTRERSGPRRRSPAGSTCPSAPPSSLRPACRRRV